MKRRLLVLLLGLLTALPLAACAPKLQRLGPTVTEPTYAGDRLLMDDGVALPLRHWPAEGETKAVVLAVHGFNEYSKVFKKPAQEWAKSGIETYAYDQRGFGEAPHRGLWPGDQRLVDDLKQAARVLRARHPDRPFYVLGESMGGAVVMVAATDSDPLKADGLILVAPAIWGRQTIGPVGSGALWLFAHTIPWYTVDGRGLHVEPSDNREMLRELAHDQLVIKQTRVDAVYGLVGLMDQAWAAAPSMPAHSLFLYGVKEQVIDDEAVVAMLRRLPRGASAPRIALYPDGYHMLLRDLHGDIVRRDVLAWIYAPGAGLPSTADLRAKRLLVLPSAGLAAASSSLPSPLTATR